MASLNRVLLLGHLGADPELRYTPSGAAVCNFRIATNEVWTDKSGEKQEKTEWHNIVIWGRQAEICGEYLAKGRQVLIEGSLQTRSWEDKEGNKRYTTEVKARNMQMLGRGDGGGGGGGGRAPRPAEEERAAQEPAAAYDEPIPDDDIPF